MKNLFKSLALLSALITPLSAQTEGVGYGFLNIANLIPGTDSCQISIGGEVLVPDGLKASSYTGWFMVKPGSKSIKITVGELDTASGTVQIIEGIGNLVGIFLEPDKRVDSEGKPFPPKIRIKSFPTYNPRGYGLKFVSLCPDEGRFQLGNLKFDAEPLKPVDIPKWNGSGFEILRSGESIGKAAGSPESGAFYLLVGTDSEGAYSTVLVSTNPQEVPDYLKPDNAEDKKETTSPEQTTAEP
jgi:hypothetical protein